MKLLINKNDNGHYYKIPNKQNDIKYYLSIGFGKETVKPSKSTLMEVKDAFFSCYKANDGSIKPKLIIMEYQVLTEYESDRKDVSPYEKKDSSYIDDFGSNIVLDEPELPF